MPFKQVSTMRYCYTFAALTIGLSLGGCATLPGGGPSTGQIQKVSKQVSNQGPIEIVDVTDAVAARMLGMTPKPSFASALGDVPATGVIIGRGDGLDVTIWEAPPAVLFSPGMISSVSTQATANASAGRPTELPQQVVGSDGRIDVPFAGSVLAAGRTPQEVAKDIRNRLNEKAHDPQVLVRLSQNATSDITVIGEVTNSLRMPLTAKGERVLDALASAGGVKQPIGKMTVQVTRGEVVEAMPLQIVIREPRENVRLISGDVVTLLFQPYSFTVLGAARSNQEVAFESTGLTLSQALGRMGGLDDQRANPRGVFIFRYEDSSVLRAGDRPVPLAAQHGRIPVIYRVNMRDPNTLFVAQSFPIRDKDVIYVSNAPLADFSKFLQAVSQIVYPIATIQNTKIF